MFTVYRHKELKYKGTKYLESCQKKQIKFYNSKQLNNDTDKNVMYNQKTLIFTFHHYWGAFCQGAFVWGGGFI